MKWQIKSMVDPGDGIVSTTVVEHPSYDLCEVAADAFNGEGLLAEDGEPITFCGWIFSIEAIPPEN